MFRQQVCRKLLFPGSIRAAVGPTCSSSLGSDFARLHLTFSDGFEKHRPKSDCAVVRVSAHPILRRLQNSRVHGSCGSWGWGSRSQVTGSQVFIPSKSQMIALGSEDGAWPQFLLQRPIGSVQGLGSDRGGLSPAVTCVLAGFGQRFSQTSRAFPARAYAQGGFPNRVKVRQGTCILGLPRVSKTQRDQNDPESGRNLPDSPACS